MKMLGTNDFTLNDVCVVVLKYVRRCSEMHFFKTWTFISTLLRVACTHQLTSTKWGALEVVRCHFGG